jgi:hypothetical protein
MNSLKCKDTTIPLIYKTFLKKVEEKQAYLHIPAVLLNCLIA